jgi:N-acetyl-alpha-D-glucosaminyl L-malate synthase BshA
LFEYVPYDLALATKMVEVFHLVKLDLLHVHYAVPHSISGYLAREMVKPERLPVVTTLHGTDITLVGRDHSYLPITQFGIRQSDGVTAVSHFLKDATIEGFCPCCDIRVIPNFIDVEQVHRFFSQEIRQRFAPKGERILVHLSNFRPVKRIPDVVKIFNLVQKETPAVLLMIGDGVERSNAQYLVSEMGIANRVFFVGMLGMVESYLSVCDLLLLPSQTESFGVSALEAMACEVPVVASRVGGLPELVRDGETGYLCPVGDVEAMAAAALRILGGGELDAFRQAARRRAVEHFSADRVVPMYEGYYREILGR